MRHPSLRCPRCGRTTMRINQVENALSRTTRGVSDKAVYVCSPCGTDEGLQDFFDEGATPQSEWPVEHLKYALQIQEYATNLQGAKIKETEMENNK